MRKIIFIVLLIVLLTFTIPIVFTKKFATKDTLSNAIQENSENTISENTQKYTYDKYGIIRLLHAKDSSVEELNIDEYLLGVVSAEMPADFEEEALKAQAVAARTFYINKLEENNDYKINSTISPGPRVYDTKEEAESAAGDKSYYISTVKVEWEE